MLAPNTFLQNRYLIVSLLAQGGMGAVYLAKDQRLDSSVALKESFFTDDRLRRAFEREAQMLARLRHPALPRVSDHFTENEGQFLVMEFIPGDDLGRVLEKRKDRVEPIGQVKPFDPDDVIDWADQLLNALHYLHSRQPAITHRDIKPRNLKLADGGQIILLDFGLAKLSPLQLSRVTSSGSIYGYTPNYAPIEQIRGIGTDARSDLYSLGATLYHLMTGTPPVDALTRADEVLGGGPDPLRLANDINPMVPEAVARVLMQAMAQHKNQRPASAAEMRELLRAARQSLAPTVRGGNRDTLVEPPTVISPEKPTDRAPSTEQTHESDEMPTERPLSAGAAISYQTTPSPTLQGIKARPALPTQAGVAPAPVTNADARNPSPAVTTKESVPVEKALTGQVRWLAVGGAIIILIALAVVAARIFDSTGSDPSQTAPPSSPGANPTGPASPVYAPGRVLTARQPVNEVALSADGKTLASSSDETPVGLWQVNDGNLLNELPGHAKSGRCVALSPDGQTVASGSDDGRVRLWRVSDGNLISTLRGHTNWVFGVGFSPDGQTLFSASGDKTIRFWRVSDGEVAQTINTPERGYLIVTVSPDQRLAAFYHPDGVVKLWSVSDDSLLRLLEGDVSDVTCGAFSADGRTLALGSKDGAVRLWRVSDGGLIRKLEAASVQSQAGCVAFTPNSQIVGAGYSDGKIRLWRVYDGGLLKVLEGHSKSVRSLSFSADGRWLASGSEDKTIRLWEAKDATN